MLLLHYVFLNKAIRTQVINAGNR